MQDMLPLRKCATPCLNYPQSCGRSSYLFRCFSLNVHLSVLAVCPCNTDQGPGFRTSITDYNDTELSNKLFLLRSTTQQQQKSS